MSKYWETGEKNKFGKECYKLHFMQFYDDEVSYLENRISSFQENDD